MFKVKPKAKTPTFVQNRTSPPTLEAIQKGK
jgi:hypothetical protein